MREVLNDDIQVARGDALATVVAEAESSQKLIPVGFQGFLAVIQAMMLPAIFVAVCRICTWQIGGVAAQRIDSMDGEGEKILEAWCV